MVPTSASHGTPRVILITGEPGSGKTTLGTDLARALRIPFLARDVRGGLFFTAGGWTDRPRSVPTSNNAVEAFLRIVETMAGLGASCIAEYVIRESRPQDFERIMSITDCVVIQTWCGSAADRFVARAPEDLLLNRRAVLDALGHDDIDQHTNEASTRRRSVVADMQTEFDVPVMRVNTDDGYAPPLEGIIDFVTSGDRAR